MYSKNQILNIIAFDIETVSEFKDLETLKKERPKIAELWEKRCEYLRNKHEDNRNLSNGEIYKLKASLQAEFGKIICISIAYTRFDDHDNPIIKTKSFVGDNERDLLINFSNFLNTAAVKLPNSILAGHSIKRFDIPFLCKRLIINDLNIPSQLNFINKKPWEINIHDTAEIWSFGAWQESFISLDLITNILNIPSPKNEIDGSKINEIFWNENNMDKISKYCEYDAAAVINIILKLSKFKTALIENIISV